MCEILWLPSLKMEVAREWCFSEGTGSAEEPPFETYFYQAVRTQEGGTQ